MQNKFKNKFNKSSPKVHQKFSKSDTIPCTKVSVFLLECHWCVHVKMRVEWLEVPVAGRVPVWLTAVAFRVILWSPWVKLLVVLVTFLANVACAFFRRLGCLSFQKSRMLSASW